MDESIEYIDAVDEVVRDAFMNGFTTKHLKYKDVYGIKERLGLYGYEKTEDYVNRYYLNELGVVYVMEGCSNGVERRMQYTVDSLLVTIKMKEIAEEANLLAHKADKKVAIANAISFATAIAAIMAVVLQIFTRQ